MYWMIQQMTYQFAQEETGMKLMGKRMDDFDPTLDYFYKPVSQSIESEQSKDLKVQKWIQTLGYMSQIVQGRQDGPKIINYILSKMYSYMGDEFVNFSDALLNPEEPIASAAGQQQGAGQPASNEQGIPQSPMEQQVRGQA
jgi:hypothetical protein